MNCDFSLSALVGTKIASPDVGSGDSLVGVVRFPIHDRGFPPSAGAYMKIRRADVHLHSLKDAIETFIDSNPYGVELELNYETGAMTLYGRVFREPSFEVLRWGVLIGDVVHNLRSALDHLAWKLTVSTPPPNPIPRNSPLREIGFPIVLQEAKWEDVAAKKLFGASAHVRAVVKRLQPFVTGQDAPDREPLAILQELWNTDKHRYLNLTNTFVQILEIKARQPFPEMGDLPPVNWRVLSKADAGPFEDGAKLATVEWDAPFLSSLPHMHMDPRVHFDIAFEQGSPAYGGRVIPTLESISLSVREAFLALRDEVLPDPQP